jgi:hypothetical protein
VGISEAAADSRQQAAVLGQPFLAADSSQRIHCNEFIATNG